MPFFGVDKSEKCIDALVDKAFDSTFNADYYLFIPIETKTGKGRIMILESNFKKYMIALDSTYSINANLRAYLKNILTGKQKMFFHEFFYKERFGQIEYQILYKKSDNEVVLENRKKVRRKNKGVRK